MSAALLARYGVAVEVFERRSEVTCSQSRAVGIQRDVVAIYDRFGFGPSMLQEGTSWSLSRTYRGGQEILRRSYRQDRPELYPPFVNIPQFRMEEMLHAQATSTTQVRIHYNTEVVGVEQDASGVTVSTMGPSGEGRHSGAYLIGADGLGSRVRKLVDIPFEGWQTEGRFVVADFRAHLSYAHERKLWFDPPFYPHGIVLMHAIAADNQWRLDWQIDPDDSGEDFLEENTLIQRIRDAVADDDVEIEVLRANTFTFQQRRAAHFRQGRVFLAGDAAHVVSPFGGRGMNSGMEDADNLSWKLSHVLHRRAPESLLKTYGIEREAVADVHLDITAKTMQFMVPPDDAAKQYRDSILAAAAADPTQQHLIDSGHPYQPVPYLTSPLTIPAWDADHGAHNEAMPGHLIIDGNVSQNGQHTTLRRALAGRFSVLAVPASGGSTTTTQQWLDLLALPEWTLFDGVLLCPPAEASTIPAGTPVLVDERGELWERIAGDSDRVFIIRPDCYIAARADVADIHRLLTQFTAAVGSDLPTTAANTSQAPIPLAPLGD